MAKGTDENTKKYWQEMLADMQEKIKGNKTIPLENNDIQALNAKTNIAIGTLNGYFGLDKSKMPATYPNADTRNLLAQYLGFADWNDYVKSKALQTVETENPKITIMDNINLEEIKEFISQKYNSEDFNSLCMIHFWDVYNAFEDKQSKIQKINALIEYCIRNPKELEKLIRVLKEKK